jgi:hypothetical protein
MKMFLSSFTPLIVTPCWPPIFHQLFKRCPEIIITEKAEKTKDVNEDQRRCTKGNLSSISHCIAITPKREFCWHKV